MSDSTSPGDPRSIWTLGDLRHITLTLPDDAVIQLSTIEADPNDEDADWRFVRDVCAVSVNHYPNGAIEIVFTDTQNAIGT